MTLRQLIHWDRPFNVPVRQNAVSRSLTSLNNDMNRLFQNFFNHEPWIEEYEAFPAVDIIENHKSFKIKAELPGINPEDVEISVTDGFLTLKGHIKEETEEKDQNYLRRETCFGAFQRTIALPDTANCDKSEATFKNGVLRIEVPKKAEAVQKPKKLEIKKAA
jgi:HSP20 family protein